MTLDGAGYKDPSTPLQDISTRSIMNKTITTPYTYIQHTALVQVSSAQVERIFSQVKLICQTTAGVTSPLEETVGPLV